MKCEDEGVVLMEDEYIVRMPPIREYKIRIKGGNVEKASPPNLVVEDEVMDAMEICGWDELSDEAWEGFEKLAEESAPKLLLDQTDLSSEFITPPTTLLDKIRYWSFDDWIDWLMGR